MGVRVIHDTEDDYTALYCSTTMVAFGPVFGNDEKHGKNSQECALAFLHWLRVNGHRDARSYTDSELEDLMLAWLGANDRCWWVDLVISMRVADTDRCVPGSTRETCLDCREPVWLAPPTAGVLRANPGAPLVCTQCGVKRADASNKP